MTGWYLRKHWRAVDVGRGFEDGVNFYDDFERGVVNHGLRTLHTALEQDGYPCYCLRLNIDASNRGYFCQFADVLTPSNMPKKDFLCSGVIPLELLVDKYWEWPSLAVYEGPLLLADHGILGEDGLIGLLKRVSWHAQVRLQREYEYLGYFITVGVGTSAVPTDHELIAAAYKTKINVAAILAYRRVERARTSENFKLRLLTAQTAIENLQGKRRTEAFQHVGDMLTSHLGAGWNRAACYCPIGNDTLRCLWAQGGSGEHGWCRTVQRPIGETVRQTDGLVYLAQRRVLARDDPYYTGAVLGQPLQIAKVSDEANDNVLAQLWRARGDVTALLPCNRAWEPPPPPDDNMDKIDRTKFRRGDDIAAFFDQEDPWVQQVTRERPGQPIFISQNGKYWAFPWWAYQKLIGIWVLDMAYWAHAGDQPSFPSLGFTQEILSALGPSMYQFWPNHWGHA